MKRRTLVGLMLATVACTPPPDPDGPYEGSCPILIECTAKLNSPREAEYLDAYGERGTCWALGPYHWGECRDSCVEAIDSLNAASLEVGIAACGTCELNSDCSEAFEGSRCEAGYCARGQLGDVSGGDSESGTDSGIDTNTTTGAADGSIDETCLLDDTPTVVLDTSLGVMVVELDSLAAPEATHIFLQHVSANFYDGSIIHRVVPEVVIQAGLYGPGPTQLSSPIAPIERLTAPTLEHQPGVIALVPTYDGSHLGAQWYMTAGPTPPSADTSGVVFGAIVNGMDVLVAVSSVPVTTVAWVGFQLHDIPEQDVVINEAYCVAQWP